MDSARLLEITAYWSFWEDDVPTTVPRDVALPARLSDSLALVVQGVRRCGKSTLLAQMIDRYRLNPRHCAFLNFEDPRLGQRLDHSLLDAWVAAFRKSHPRLKKAYFFLDEIQGVSGWEKWLRTQLERPVVVGRVVRCADRPSSHSRALPLRSQLYPSPHCSAIRCIYLGARGGHQPKLGHLFRITRWC